MDAKTGNRYKTRYFRLAKRRQDIDIKIAVLMSTIRAEFPKGISGTVQARDWVRRNLGLKGKTADKHFAAGEVYRRHGVEPWKLLLDWRAITYFSRCSVQRQFSLLKVLRAIVKKDGGNPVSQDRLRIIAIKMGEPVGKRGGAPTRSKVLDDRDVLIDYVGVLLSYIDRLHEEFDLPAPPAKVANPPKKVVRIMRNFITRVSETVRIKLRGLKIKIAA